MTGEFVPTGVGLLRGSGEDKGEKKDGFLGWMESGPVNVLGTGYIQYWEGCCLMPDPLGSPGPALHWASHLKGCQRSKYPHRGCYGGNMNVKYFPYY